jgi:hypothetical protein
MRGRDCRPSRTIGSRAIGEADLEAPTVGDALRGVRDDANGTGHPGMIPRSRPTGKRLEIVRGALPTQVADVCL